MQVISLKKITYCSDSALVGSVRTVPHQGCRLKPPNHVACLRYVLGEHISVFHIWLVCVRFPRKHVRDGLPLHGKNTKLPKSVSSQNTLL